MSCDESLVLSSKGRHYQYNRTSFNDLSKLSHLLMQRYPFSNKCFIVPSGMSAICVAIQSILRAHQSQKITQPINLIYGDELYCDTPKTITYLASGHDQIHRYTIDITQTESILKLFKSLRNSPDDTTGHFNILFIESCTNPSGFIMDFSILPQLRQLSSQLVVIVDNTWLTDLIFNPFQYDVDVVVTSLTKYYSAGSAIAGAIVSRSQFDWYFEEHIKRNGLHVSPHNIGIIIENLSSMEQRLRQSSHTTIKVLQQLQSMLKISTIIHPAMDTHPSHQLALQYFQHGLWPSVFTMVIPVSKETALHAMESSSMIEHKTSFGGRLSRTDPWPHEVNGTTICRIAIGYDDTETNVVMGLTDLIETMIPSPSVARPKLVIKRKIQLSEEPNPILLHDQVESSQK